MLSLLFSAVPAAVVARSTVETASGTLGEGVVGAHELRDNAVGLSKIAEISGGTVVGRAPGPSGAAGEVDGAILRSILAASAEVVVLPTRIDAVATFVAPTVGALQVLGYEESGDGGAAVWRRSGVEPPHPGKFQSADGSWWEIAEPVVRPEMFGATAQDGVTDEGAALREALDCAIATGRVIELAGTYATYSDIIVDTAFHMRGVRGRSTLIFFSRTQLLVKRGDGMTSTPNGTIENVIFRDGENSPSWIGKPLLEVWRAAHWRLQSCVFDGRVRRRYGAWLGRGSTIFASTFSDNRFVSCQYGVVIGDQGDATHNDFIGNTCDHNRFCGAVFANPHGGLIASNSFEHNRGPIGLAITSFTNGGAAKAVGTTIRSNYVFNNNLDASGGAEDNPISAGILIGHDVPGGLFTSAGGAWNMEIANNYIVSPTCWRAIRANLVQAGVIRDNVVTRTANSQFDIELSGTVAAIKVEGNKNQNLPEFDSVTAPTAWQVPAATLDGRLRVAGATAIGYAARSSGSAGVAGELVSLDGAGEAALVLGTVARTDGSHRASFVVHLARDVNGVVAPLSLSGDPDAAEFTVLGGSLRLRRNGAWNANCSFLFCGRPGQ